MRREFVLITKKFTVMAVVLIMVSLVIGCATTRWNEYESSLRNTSDLWLQNRLVEIDAELAKLGYYIRSQQNTPYDSTNPYESFADGFSRGYTQGSVNRLLTERTLILKELNRRRYLREGRL